MRPFVDIVIETTNLTGAMNRLHSFGLEKGNGIRLFTGLLESVGGLSYFTFRVWEDRINVIPENNAPPFTILWRSDVYVDDGEGNMVLEPWPMVEVQAYDIDGNPDGTRMQGVGRIA
jgi:hypothetical protein